MPSISPMLRQALEAASIDPSSLSISGNIATSSSSTGQTQKYFIRSTSSTASTTQLVGEARGLLAMSSTSPSLVPHLYAWKTSEDGSQGAMVSTYFDFSVSRGGGRSIPAIQRELGIRLAQMHTVPPREGWDKLGYKEGKYGFEVPTHCGVTEQDNTWEESWEVFWRERRLGNLVRRIEDRQVTEAWESLKRRAVPSLLRDIRPEPKPVIIHGDLWSGNYGVDGKTGQAKIFDPSSYWGHSEAELGMTHMFGGFTKDFYDAYHEVHPRSEPYHEQRIKLYELYHHLNHTLMFGGSYKSGALGIMRSLSDWADSLTT